MLDYIVVGLGLSGIAISEELEKRGKSFLFFDDGSQNSSHVAGGLFNPVILKRYTLAWKADEQLELAIPFYRKLEQKLGKRFVNFWNIYKRFHSPEDQNEWFIAADRAGLEPFLDQELERNHNPHLIADYALGKVLHTGNIDTSLLLDSYKKYLKRKGLLKEERFCHESLEVKENHLEYENLKARNIIFCEGFGLKKNPFFNYLPLRGNKGEYITIKAPDLKLGFAVKASVFLMPLGSDLYKVGATYNNFDKSPEPTTEARVKLVKEVAKLITCDFEVVDQVAGIRPSVADRRPLVGAHPEISNLFCCNGFGSRGVLISPWISGRLLDHIETGKELDRDLDLQRFTRKHYKRS